MKSCEASVPLSEQINSLEGRPVSFLERDMATEE